MIQASRVMSPSLPTGHIADEPVRASYSWVVRDYTVGGSEEALAQANGLVDADWYRPHVDRSVLKTLVTSRSRIPVIHLVIWVVLLVVTGWWANTAWGSVWALPAFFAYGTLYGSTSDARWHEFGHRTAFRRAWTNDVVYSVASFMTFREPESWRWSHARHHSDTIVVGRDPEIAFPRPTSRLRIVAEFFGLLSARNELVKIARNMVGRPAAPQRNYQPADTLRKSQVWSWVFFLVLASVAVWCVIIGSVKPAMFIGLPSVYGKWLLMAYGITQHAGLSEDVLDHRMNTRTVHMNAIHRFLYLNMNYHLEHHIFPNVPYDALPRLHELVKDQLPPAHRTIRGAWREAFDAMARQRDDQSYNATVQLPSSAA